MDSLVGASIRTTYAVDLRPIAGRVLDGDRLVEKANSLVLRNRTRVVGNIELEPIIGVVVGQGERKGIESVAGKRDIGIPTESTTGLCYGQAMLAGRGSFSRLRDRSGLASKAGYPPTFGPGFPGEKRLCRRAVGRWRRSGAAVILLQNGLQVCSAA